MNNSGKITLEEIIEGLGITPRQARKILRYANIYKEGYYWTFDAQDKEHIRNILKRYIDVQ